MKNKTNIIYVCKTLTMSNRRNATLGSNFYEWLELFRLVFGFSNRSIWLNRKGQGMVVFLASNFSQRFLNIRESDSTLNIT